MIEFVVIFEQGLNNWSAYVPDLPGCIATGTTREDTERLLHEAIELHIAFPKEEGEPVPPASSFAGLIAGGA